MLIRKSIIAAAMAAAFAVPATFAASTTTTTSSTSSNANFGQVMTSIQASKTGATQIQGLTDVKSVNVVKVSELPDISQGQNKTDFDAAVTKNDADITSLRTAITSNTAVNSALQKQNVDVNSVVAADVGTDGTLTVYVR
jgi:TolA-binding protein